VALSAAITDVECQELIEQAETEATERIASPFPLLSPVQKFPETNFQNPK
jgi:hypothetical protein